MYSMSVSQPCPMFVRLTARDLVGSVRRAVATDPTRGSSAGRGVLCVETCKRPCISNILFLIDDCVLPASFPPQRSARARTTRAHMDLQLAPPHDAWDALTQSWITELPQAALARAQAVPAASLTKAKLSISPPLSKPSPPWVPPPVVTPQVPAAEAAPPAAASGSEEVPMTPEAQEASSLALAWRLQQEEQAAFYHAIHENTPGPTARSIAATPGEAPLMGALGEPESPEDASLQLALRLQQARDRSSH